MVLVQSSFYFKAKMFRYWNIWNHITISVSNLAHPLMYGCFKFEKGFVTWGAGK